MRISRRSLRRHDHRHFHIACQQLWLGGCGWLFRESFIGGARLTFSFHAPTRARFALPLMRGM
jgi:hypothetical protein